MPCSSCICQYSIQHTSLFIITKTDNDAVAAYQKDTHGCSTLLCRSVNKKKRTSKIYLNEKIVFVFVLLVKSCVSPFVGGVDNVWTVLEKESGHLDVTIAGRVMKRYEAALVAHLCVDAGVGEQVLGQLEMVVAGDQVQAGRVASARIAIVDVVSGEESLDAAQIAALACVEEGQVALEDIDEIVVVELECHVERRLAVSILQIGIRAALSTHAHKNINNGIILKKLNNQNGHFWY